MISLGVTTSRGLWDQWETAVDENTPGAKRHLLFFRLVSASVCVFFFDQGWGSVCQTAGVTGRTRGSP